ncbi:hypothetical protein FB446DRAFT_795076 [Lentinula raphanica]|nr:hypothetical protein FB446DRAFT_795076 [Lentinula raphanica]
MDEQHSLQHTYSYEPFFTTDPFSALYPPLDIENSILSNNDIPQASLAYGGTQYDYREIQQDYSRERPRDEIFAGDGQVNVRSLRRNVPAPVPASTSIVPGGGVRADVFGLRDDVFGLRAVQRGNGGVMPRSIHIYFILVSQSSSPALASHEHTVNVPLLLKEENGFFSLSVTSALSSTFGVSLPPFILRAIDDQRTILATVQVLPDPYETIESLFGFRLLGDLYETVSNSTVLYSAVGGSQRCKFVLVFINPSLVDKMTNFNSCSANANSNAAAAAATLGDFSMNRRVDLPSVPIDYQAHIADARSQPFPDVTSSWPYPPLGAHCGDENQTQIDERSFENTYAPSAAQMLLSQSSSSSFPSLPQPQSFMSTEAFQGPGVTSSAYPLYMRPRPLADRPRTLKVVLTEACESFGIPEIHGTEHEKKGKACPFPELVQDWTNLTELLQRLGYNKNRGLKQRYDWEHGGSATFGNILQALNWTARDFREKNFYYDWARVASRTKMWDPQDPRLKYYVLGSQQLSRAAKGKRKVRAILVDPYNTWKRVEYFFSETNLAYSGHINTDLDSDNREKDLVNLRHDHIKTFYELIDAHLVDRQ